MFFKVLAAIVSADAFDRHRRRQQHHAWALEDARRQAAQAAATVNPVRPSPQDASDPQLQLPPLERLK